MSTSPGSTLLAILAAAACAFVFCGVIVGYSNDGEKPPLPNPPEGNEGYVKPGAALRCGVGVTTSWPRTNPAPPMAAMSIKTVRPLVKRHWVLLMVIVLAGDGSAATTSLVGTSGFSSSQSIGTSFILIQLEGKY